jgi:hypothetical protein
MKKVKVKKRNPQDVTLRNIRAAKVDIQIILERLKIAEMNIKTIFQFLRKQKGLE